MVATPTSITLATPGTDPSGGGPFSKHERSVGASGVTCPERYLRYEEYHPFGTTSWWATNGSTDVSAKRYRYTGKERDDETGLGYHGARYYAAWLGRWERPDPAGMVDGPNRFAYAKNRPTTLVDPTGMATRDEDLQSRYLQRPPPNLDLYDAETVVLGGAGPEKGTGFYAKPLAAELERAGLPGPVEYVPISRGLAHASNISTTLMFRGHREPSNPGISTLTDWVNRADIPGKSNLNYVGYSYGSVVAAQSAAARLDEGKDVGFVVLIGTPIDPDSCLKSALTNDPRVGKVVTVDIAGDPFSSGIHPTQLFDATRHFEFANPTAAGTFPTSQQQELADALADILATPTPQSVQVTLPSSLLNTEEFMKVQPYLESDPNDDQPMVVRDLPDRPSFAP